MPEPTFKAREEVTVLYEQEGDTHIQTGDFVALDETGLMLQCKERYVFWPRERIVMIQKVAA